MEQRIVLETDRLFLREMNMDDFDALYKVLADTDIMQHYPYAFDEKRVRVWIEKNMNRYSENGFGLWAVCLKDTGEMIGDCGLTLQNIEGEMLPEIGYHIRADHQHKGYAKEAAAAVRDWAFVNTDYPALYSCCKYTNVGSYKTAESIGMHFEKEYPDSKNKMTLVSVIHRPTTRQQLASVAKAMAQIPYHGFADGKKANLEPIVQPFPKWTIEEADSRWCAAFVYYCCRKAGFEIPIRPDECTSCHLAGCIAWEEFAIGDPRIEYHTRGDSFVPESGDIVLYDHVFDDHEHDHIGIIVEKHKNTILAAEGNIDNRSEIVERPIDGHIRAYIRIPDGYKYSMDLKDFDNKCVRITDVSGAVYEGTASYFDREYVLHEYGCDQEALCLTPMMFYKNDISSVINLEGTNGSFGHYSEKYGLLEKSVWTGGLT